MGEYTSFSILRNIVYLPPKFPDVNLLNTIGSYYQDDDSNRLDNDD